MEVHIYHDIHEGPHPQQQERNRYEQQFEVQSMDGIPETFWRDKQSGLDQLEGNTVYKCGLWTLLWIIKNSVPSLL